MKTRASILILTLIPAPALSLGAQQVAIQGGGEINVGKLRYTFEPISLAASSAKAGTPGAYLIQGQIKPVEGKGPLYVLDLTLTDKGQIYTLSLVHKRGKDEEDRWAATLKTKVKILSVERRLGGTLKLELGGPLTGIQEGAVATTTWQGELWATFSSHP